MFANWMVHFIALVQEFGSHLFVPNSSNFIWDKVDGQYVLASVSLPQLNTAGKEFVDSLFTIMCNVVIYLAQVSASLPVHPPT